MKEPGVKRCVAMLRAAESSAPGALGRAFQGQSGTALHNPGEVAAPSQEGFLFARLTL